MTAENRSRLTKSLIASAILSQLFSFASKCVHQIGYHGAACTRIARHLRQGEFHADINACSLSDGSIMSQGILQFTADVQNAQDLMGTWSVSDGAINSTGLFAAPRVVTSQQVTVTAASKEDPTKSGQAIPAVTPPPREPGCCQTPASAKVDP